ncbi:hypothetical protein T265_00093 [Opisthorchis viverrini]|uniref:Uncharacterized protein n=1 Tax=Opisthorchis viverrini TaxID=6198 RepID=A0A075A4F7_OPIVI|nr:hypothetical protein T265_00093 [Opisthorchis viverrini]KER34241.1 hypothetical protein T265_00093 [Opisthorchis viverrini]
MQRDLNPRYIIKRCWSGVGEDSRARKMEHALMEICGEETSGTEAVCEQAFNTISAAPESEDRRGAAREFGKPSEDVGFSLVKNFDGSSSSSSSSKTASNVTTLMLHCRTTIRVKREKGGRRRVPSTEVPTPPTAQANWKLTARTPLTSITRHLLPQTGSRGPHPGRYTTPTTPKIFVISFKPFCQVMCCPPRGLRHAEGGTENNTRLRRWRLPSTDGVTGTPSWKVYNTNNTQNLRDLFQAFLPSHVLPTSRFAPC